MAERNPVGEKAFYKIDTKSGRTTAMVQSGDILGSVVSLVADYEGRGPAYEVKLDYKLNVAFSGSQTGSQSIGFEQQYFEPEFITDLRVNGLYKGTNFTVKHLGYRDAKNMDGMSYPHCDYLYFYDIETTPASVLWRAVLEPIARSLFPNEETFANKIEDLEIWAHHTSNIPVLGGAKIDLKGKYRGSRIKAGADYIAKN